MKKTHCLCALMAIAVAPSLGHAQGIGLLAHAGSLGLGGDVAISLNRYLGIRGGGNFFPMDFDINISDIDFTFDLPSPQFTATLDLFPTGGGLRISAGVLFSNNDLTIEGDLTGSVDIGDATYGAAQVGTLTGAILTKDASPYVGIGFGNPARSTFGFFLELGVAFKGEPEVTLEADGPAASLPAFQADLERERRDAEDDPWINVFRYYPIVSMGFSVGF